MQTICTTKPKPFVPTHCSTFFPAYFDPLWNVYRATFFTTQSTTFNAAIRETHKSTDVPSNITAFLSPYRAAFNSTYHKTVVPAK
jgi:hypothetical protein